VSQARASGLNLGYIQSDRRSSVEKNRKLFFRGIGAERFSLATLHQIHSDRIGQVLRAADEKLQYRPSGGSRSEQPKISLSEGDALLTHEPGILLSVRSADCMPVLLVDPRQRAVAAVHAGWRGAVNGIIEKTVMEMGRLFTSRPRDLVAAVGPFIHSCCYEVGEELVETFRQNLPMAEKFFREAESSKAGVATRRKTIGTFQAQPIGDEPRSAPTAYLDLGVVAHEQLRCAGVPPTHIHISKWCTSCHTDLFFSHRREGSQTGRMMAVIGIRPR
jgi:YfiH family protein